MISPGGAYRMGEALRQMNEFAQMGNKTSLEKLMGFIDGIQENTARGILSTIREPLILTPLRNELSKKIIGESEISIDYRNYSGAYLNGYLWMAGPFKRLQDRFGNEPSRVSNSADFLGIPKFENGEYSRTKRIIYDFLRKEELMVYDDERR